VNQRAPGHGIQRNPNNSPENNQSATRSAFTQIARGGKIQEHAVQDQRQQSQEFRTYVQDAAGLQSPADQLAKLADLHDRGDITDAEFEREKAKILS